MTAAPAANDAAAADAPLSEDRIRVRHLLVKTEEEAELIRGDIRARKISFANAAQRYSIAPEGKGGGDLGWFSRGQLPKVFDSCFDLETKRLSKVVASDYGYHLFEVLERQKAGEMPRQSDAAAIARERAALAEEQALKTLENTKGQEHWEPTAASIFPFS